MTRHVTRFSPGLLAMLMVACAAQGAAATDIGDFVPGQPPAEAAGSAAPRYLNQPPADVRPLETSPPLPPADPSARYAAPEHVASGPGEFPAALPQASPRTTDAARPLPLGPPSTGAHEATRGRDLPPLVTAGASLGIVLGLFLLVVWVVRRGMPKNATLLPREAVEILGRAPLVARQQVHLLRCGNKMLLVCDSPAGVHTLTEITDPAEVERLAEMCQPSSGSGFRQMLQQFGTPPRDRRYIARHEAAEVDFAHLEAGHHTAGESRV